MSTAMPTSSRALEASVRAGSQRLTVYLKRLPLLTRVVFGAICVTTVLDFFGAELKEKFALDPDVMGLDQMHRTNLYLLAHSGLIHALFNTIALTPLLERFEREVGTLKTLLLIAGPLVTFPAFLYLGITIFLLHGHTAVQGASGLVFTFLAMEAVKTFAFKPYLTLGGVEIPSWTTPILWMVVASFLVPSSSILGHLCGLIIGYAYACRYLRLLEPSEWILNKVESKLGFFLFKLPWYVSLEKRTEMNYFEMLPMAMASSRPGAGTVVSPGLAGGTGPEGRTLG